MTAGSQPGPANPQPFVVSYYTTPNDATDWLPEVAVDRLRKLRQRVEDLRSLCPPCSARARGQDRRPTPPRAADRSSITRRLRVARGRSPCRRRGTQLAALSGEDKRLSELQATREAAWRAAATTLANVELWLRDGKPSRVQLQAFEGPEPTLHNGERNLVEAIESRRRRVRELKADLHRIESAPYPSSYCKQRARAARGAGGARTTRGVGTSRT